VDYLDFLSNEQAKPYFIQLMEKLDYAYQNKVVYPEKEKLFSAFSYASYDDLKVVIVGQDPYHQKGQAQGLAFSVEPTVKIPPSLMNILKELKDDLGCKMNNHGDLSAWAKQGVLLINTSLSVEDSKPASHAKMGWEYFFKSTLAFCSAHPQPIVFILWGKHAQIYKNLIDTKRHLILESTHPSPLSAHQGFFGSKPFSKTNQFLENHQRDTIQWCRYDV
jgi:uracil-DNA glycosylase